MLSLRYALILFVCAFAVCALYYRFYFRPRLYLLLLSEHNYMDHYIDRLPHMRERFDERRAMIDFLLDKRRSFLRNLLGFVLGGALCYVILLVAGAAA